MAYQETLKDLEIRTYASIYHPYSRQPCRPFTGSDHEVIHLC